MTVEYLSIYKADKEGDAKHALPRQSLLELLKEIDLGLESPQEMVIIYRNKDKTISHRISGFSDMITFLGILECAKLELVN